MNCQTYIAPLTMEWRSVSCLWRLPLPTSIGLLCSFNVVLIKPIDVCFLIFAHWSPCQQCHDSVAGLDVGRSAAGVEFLFYHSNFVVHQIQLKASNKMLSPPRQTFLVGNQGLAPPLHCPGSMLMTLYIHPWTQTGCKYSWWDTDALDIWQFHLQITLKTVCCQPYWH